MISFNAKLVVDSETYELSKCEYRSHRKLGQTLGQALTLMRYDPIEMRLDVGPNNKKLLDWAAKQDKFMDGKLVFYRPDGGGVEKTLYFGKARCVRYEELFVVGDTSRGSHTCRLVIAAQKITTEVLAETSVGGGSSPGRFPNAEPAENYPINKATKDATAKGFEDAQINYAEHITRLAAVRTKLAADKDNKDNPEIEKALKRAEQSYWDLELAKLSKHVYRIDNDKKGKPPEAPPDGWSLLNEATLEGQGLPPERMIDPNTGYKSAVYFPNFGPLPKKYVLAFAGTDDLHDMMTDVKQPLRIKTKQYKAAAEAARTMEKWVGHDGFELTGHSMGGGMASMGAAVTSARATTINAAGLSDKTATRAGASQDNIKESADKNRAVHSTSDPLTNIQNAVPLLPSDMGKPVPVTPHPGIQHTNSELGKLNPVKGFKAAKAMILDGHGKAQLVDSLQHQMKEDNDILNTYLNPA